jgi:hypothetical protein
MYPGRPSAPIWGIDAEPGACPGAALRADPGKPAEEQIEAQALHSWRSERIE